MKREIFPTGSDIISQTLKTKNQTVGPAVLEETNYYVVNCFMGRLAKSSGYLLEVESVPNLQQTIK